MCTHTDTEGKQSSEYSKISGKNTIFNEHPVYRTFDSNVIACAKIKSATLFLLYKSGTRSQDNCVAKSRMDAKVGRTDARDQIWGQLFRGFASKKRKLNS